MSIYLQDGTGQRGPSDEAEVLAAFNRHELSPGVMSWREGEPRWISLARRFGAPRRSRAPALAIAASLLALFVVSTALPFWGRELLPFAWRIPAPFILASVASSLAVAASLNWYLRHGEGPEVRARATFYAVVGTALLVVGCASLVQMSRLDMARRADPDAKVSVSDDGRVVRIDGIIGANFVSQFEAARASASHLDRIEINSPGGLVLDAMEVAGQVERDHLSVRAVGQCASACVAVWAASPTREMALDSRIGLHQSRVLDGLSPVWQRLSPDANSEDMDAVLSRAGFSASLIERRRATKADDMSWVTPYELRNEGVRLAIVDHTGLEANDAQVVMADVLDRDGAGAETFRLYSELARLEPKRSMEFATALRVAQLSNDHDALKKVSADLSAHARWFALRHAPAPALVRWARRLETTARRALAQRDESACGTLINGSPRNDHADTRDRKLRDLAELITRIQSADEPAVHPDQEELTRDRISAHFEHHKAQGAPGDWDRWTDIQRCAFMVDLYGDVLAWPSGDAAAAVRVIEGVVD